METRTTLKRLARRAALVGLLVGSPGVSGCEDATSIPDDLQAAGPYTCLLSGDTGTIRCRGSYNGDGFDGVEELPFAPASSFGMAVSGAEAYGVCAVSNGSVQCLGAPDWSVIHELGDDIQAALVRPPYVVLASGRVARAPAPFANGYVAAVEGLVDVADIAGTFLTACALHTDGTVTCVGDTSSWTASDADRLQGVDDVVSLVATTFNYCALRERGSVICWGGEYAGTPTLNDPDIAFDHATDLGAGLIHQCAVQDEAAWCWGYITDVDSTRLFDDAVTRVAGDVGPIVDIDGGWYHTCVLTDESRVYCIGDDGFAQSGAGTSTELREAVGF